MEKLVSFFDAQKDNLSRDLSACREAPDIVQSVTEPYLDKILVQYNEQAENDAQRNAAAMMVSTLKMSLSLTGCLAESEARGLLSSGTGSARGTLGRLSEAKKRYLPFALVLIGALFILAAIISLMTGNTGNAGEAGVLKILLSLLVSAAGAAMIFAGGRMSSGALQGAASGSGSGKKAFLQKSYLPDTDKIIRSLRASLTVIDHELENLPAQYFGSAGGKTDINAAGQEILGAAADLSGDELELMSSLIEAACSEDGPFALERLTEVAAFLHSRGYELDSPRDDNSGFFDVMPGKRSRLVRPALVKDGVLVKKGLLISGDM